jgi:hypothetical protein
MFDRKTVSVIVAYLLGILAAIALFSYVAFPS